jgi:acyl-CoA reductase-like NAD-dependent aldehyde dehydrogenase
MTTGQATSQPLLIGGEWRDARDGREYEQRFPYTGDVVGRAAAAGVEALELAQRIESGICHVNDTTVHDEPQMPFGGVKASGWGRFGGRAALEEFTELRWITVQDEPRQYPI